MATNATAPAVREAVKALTGAIGWIGASIAGLTALCYGAGYFVIHTHLIMLGLSDVVDVSNDQLLLEGGRFFYWTLAQLAVGWIIIIVAATAVCAIAWTIYQIPLVRRNKAVMLVHDWLSSARAKGLKSELLPLIAIGVVAWHFDAYYDALSSVLGLNNLLFSAPDPHAGSEVTSTAAMIMSGSDHDRMGLIGSYNFFVRVYALFIAVIWLMIYKRSSTAFGKAANFLFIIYTVLLAAFLPQAFAVLVRTPFYPVANLTLKDGQQVHGLIVQRTDHTVLIWIPEARRAVSLGADDVPKFEVVGERDIFGKEQPPCFNSCVPCLSPH